MGIKLTNNANATLAAGINSSATSITLTSGQGARFPTLTASDYFYATLIDTSNNLEIVKCTARSTDVLTVVRAQESTTARAYVTGDRIEIRLTAQTFIDAVNEIGPTQVSDEDNSSTGYFDLPVGTTGQRPGSPAFGMIRANSTTGYIEYYDAASSSWLGIGAFSATGGTVTTVGSYTYHTFTSSGAFVVTSGAKSVEYLIVGGGGSCRAGAHATGGGGGGAGGLIDSSVTATPQTYSIVIGAGGAGASGAGNGSSGDNSTAFGQTAIGGGRGAAYSGHSAASGGSGGGGGYGGSDNGAGTAGQGNAGGTGIGANSRVGGGGGGAGGAGGNSSGSDSSAVAGNGGVGINWKSLGTFYAGGGGGGAAPWTEGGKTAGTGGSGGGGNGARSSSQVYTAGANGSANRGGGAGGSSVNGPDNSTDYQAGASGGSGVVIVRYLT